MDSLKQLKIKKKKQQAEASYLTVILTFLVTLL